MRRRGGIWDSGLRLENSLVLCTRLQFPSPLPRFIGFNRCAKDLCSIFYYQVTSYALCLPSWDALPANPGALDSPLGASRICPQFVDINQHWEYLRIIGEEDVDGLPCYEMDWCPSLIPTVEVKNMKRK